MPQWLPSDPDNGRPKRQKAPKKQHRLAERNPGRLNSAISNEMYMQINLQDLEAYTNQILEAERARRRSVLCRVGCLALWLGLVFVGGYTWNQGGMDPDDDFTNTTMAEGGDMFQDFDRDRNYKAYPLTACELDLAHNTSFHDLVTKLKKNTAAAKHWHCRPEVSTLVCICK